MSSGEKRCVYCDCILEGRKVKVCNNVECLELYKLDCQQRKKESRDRTIIEMVCTGCGKIFLRRFRKRNIEKRFCNRSCASKFYIENGVYDKWLHHNDGKRTGEKINCLICGKEIYRKPSYVVRNIAFLCSNNCRHEYQKTLVGPNTGKKESNQTKEKKKETLLRKYGVTNAYQLAKHISLSKPQKEIYEYFKERFQDLKIFVDYPISRGRFKADIFVEGKNIVIEYNGSYWHCDPREYKADYFNKKKGLYAYEIWKYDNERTKALEKNNFVVYTIWEMDYKENKTEVLNTLSEVINGEKNQSADDIRPCVSLGWAHEKSGELLEHPNGSSYYNIGGNAKCESSKNEEIGQSAAKLLSGNSGEGSETTVSLK